MRKRPAKNAMQVIQDLQLTTGLKVCLDAGDVTSVPTSSSQMWNDLSGGGNHFYVGNDNSVAADDPTFVGNAGNRSHNEYWSFDGGDSFKYAAATPSWVNDIHKDNALYTFALWMYLAGTGSVGFLGSSATDADPGFFLGRSASDSYLFQVNKDTAGASKTATGPVLSTGQWLFLSFSLNEPGGIGAAFMGVDTSFTTSLGTYTSPSALDTVNFFGLGCRRATATGASSRISSGSRMAMCMIWSGVYLTQTQVTGLYNGTRRRFGK